MTGDPSKEQILSFELFLCDAVHVAHGRRLMSTCSAPAKFWALYMGSLSL